MIRRELEELCPRTICVDIGAAYYPHKKWRWFINSEKTTWIAVEPNAENLSYLSPWKYKSKLNIISQGCSRISGPQTLYVTNIPSGSSLKKPLIDPSMQRRINEANYYFPFEERQVNCISLVDLLKSIDGDDPIFLKLDTQGSELDILQGASDLFSQKRFIGIETEATMLKSPTYENSGKFYEIYKYLDLFEYELVDMNLIQNSSRFKNKKLLGKRIPWECDAVFALNANTSHLIKKQIQALFFFYLSYNLFEEAYNLVDQFPSHFATNRIKPNKLLSIINSCY